jgi:hypothetical protein
MTMRNLLHHIGHGRGRVPTNGDAQPTHVFEEARRANALASAIGMTPADYDPALIPTFAAVELKYNGICLCYGGGEARTLEGVRMECADHLIADFQDIERAFGEPMFFQAEYLLPGQPFEATQAAFNRGQPTGAAFIFEAVPIRAWEGQEHSEPLFMRRRRLEQASAQVKYSLVRPALHAQGFTQEGIELAAGAVWQDGEEGVVIKDLTAPFVRKRSRSWMKLRRELSVDVPIQSVMLDPLGYIMKIICTYEGRPIAVPNGFAKYRREADEFRVGRMVELHHNGVTKGGFLMSPRFIRFRDDKAVR